MKYVSFIIAAIVLVLLVSFVWNVFTTNPPISFNLDMFTRDDFSTVNETDNLDTNSKIDSPNTNTNDTEEEPEHTTTPTHKREGVVSISSVRNSNFSSSQPQEIHLRANLKEGEVVDITGWTVKTNEKTVKIPTGVGFYDLTGSNKETNIVLDENDRVEIYFDDRPVPKNLKLNKCTGFLNQKYDLDNVFPNRCTKVEKSKYRHLSGDCQSYISKINGDCVSPDTEFLNSLPGSDQGNACRKFLMNHFNAGYCMDKSKDSSDFLSDKWKVWIDRNRVFDPQHDWVRLLNKNGILIDERDY